jgi:hypothetical protein
MVAGADLGGAVVGASGTAGTVLGVVVAVLVGPTGGGLAVDRPSPEHAATRRPAVRKAASRRTRRRLPTACRSTRRGYQAPTQGEPAQAGGAACWSRCPPRPADGRLTGAHDLRQERPEDAWAQLENGGAATHRGYRTRRGCWRTGSPPPDQRGNRPSGHFAEASTGSSRRPSTSAAAPTRPHWLAPRSGPRAAPAARRGRPSSWSRRRRG